MNSLNILDYTLFCFYACLFSYSIPVLLDQVSFCDHNLSGICLCVCLSCCPPVKCLYFRLLLNNHLANLKQTLLKVSNDKSEFKFVQMIGKSLCLDHDPRRQRGATMGD